MSFQSNVTSGIYVASCKLEEMGARARDPGGLYQCLSVHRPPSFLWDDATVFPCPLRHRSYFVAKLGVGNKLPSNFFPGDECDLKVAKELEQADSETERFGYYY